MFLLIASLLFRILLLAFYIAVNVLCVLHDVLAIVADVLLPSAQHGTTLPQAERTQSPASVSSPITRSSHGSGQYGPLVVEAKSEVLKNLRDLSGKTLVEGIDVSG